MQKATKLPQYYFKTNRSNMIFIRMLFLHTNKEKKNKTQIYIYTHVYLQININTYKKTMQTIIELHPNKNAKLVSLHKRQLQFEETSYLLLLPVPNLLHLNLFIFMRHIDSLLLSMAPIAHLGSRPLTKPLGLSAASLFFFDLLSSDSLSDKDCLFVPSISFSAF